MAEDNLKNLIKRLSKLPGLGPRSAQRAALSLIKNKEKELEDKDASYLLTIMNL